MSAIGDHLSKVDNIYTISIPMSDGKAFAWLHKEGEILDHGSDKDRNNLVKLRLSDDNVGRFASKYSYKIYKENA